MKMLAILGVVLAFVGVFGSFAVAGDACTPTDPRLVLAAGSDIQLVQDGCPSGTNDCGNGYCCPGHLPHFCPGINRCYQYLQDAAAACGMNNVVVCGRPVR